ncbi:hypothetical protein EBU71_06425 [bacterium]|nr:hypothetical protein [Candidatus Elulimicrobium humile]
MKSIQNIINKFKVKNLSVITLPLFMIIIMLPKQANANAWEWLWNPLARLGDATFGAAINNLTGWLKATLLEILNSAIVPLVTNVMSYQNFFSTGVNAGWDITRNFANLFFALILLLIAIATVLNLSALSNYNAKNMLPKFIFVALFINFSKAIVGFLIDISQIIMITLYNSFGPSMKDIITNASKLAEAGAESNTENSTLNIFTIVLIAILAFVLLWTAVALAVRIVTLWFVIMFSPLAFMAQLVPGLQGLTSDWSKQLQSSLVNGPTLMFLLYLAFSVMKNGMLANPSSSGGNIMTNGNLINYVLTIGLLFTANTTASKASEAAPSIVKNAVGVAGTVATFGLGAYVGAGGYGTGKLFGKSKELVQGGIKNVDKGIGGATRVIQIASGGKINPNDRYEMKKQRGKERIEKGKGVENIPFIGSRIKDSRAGKWMSSVAQQTLGGEAGRKERFNATQLNMANQAKANDTLHQDPALLRARNAAVAKATEELKGASVPELIEQFKETTDEIEREAIFAKITELEGLKDLLADDEFKEYAERFETESEQIDALIKDKFESGRDNPTRSDRDFRSRIAKIGRDKKQGAYVSEIDKFEVDRDPQNNIRRDANGNTIYSRSSINRNYNFEQVKKKDISSAIADINTNTNLIRKRKEDPNVPNRFIVGQNGRSEYERDPKKVFEFINSVSSLDTLRDRKTWEKLKPELRSEFLNVLMTETPSNPTNPKYTAAIQGLTS